MNFKKQIILFFLISIGAYSFVQLVESLSPLNSHRPFINKVKYVILHTTEGDAAGALAKLKEKGEAHFLIDKQGVIFNIIDEQRVAKHAGRSLWRGLSQLDGVSIGIEMEGYHSQPLSSQQEVSLKKLLKDLKFRYQVRDENILTHSMVAYGVPNRWHVKPHRGRKRCGMLMADPKFRKRIGISPAPSVDPDVQSGRLVVGDQWLYAILFKSIPDVEAYANKVYEGPDANIISKSRSAWFIARDKYDDSNTIYKFPNGEVLKGNQITHWGSLPLGTKVLIDQTINSTGQTQVDGQVMTGDEDNKSKVDIKEIGIHGSTAYQIARSEFAKETTIYFFKTGSVLTGRELFEFNKDLLNHLPTGTKILVGYINGGRVTKYRSAYQITQKLWNSPATIYKLADGRFVNGDEVDPNNIPQGTYIFFER